VEAAMSLLEAAMSNCPPIGIFRRRGQSFITNPKTRELIVGPVQYGAWDVFCRRCSWTGTHPYPTSRDEAFRLAAEHLRKGHR